MYTLSVSYTHLDVYKRQDDNVERVYERNKWFKVKYKYLKTGHLITNDAKNKVFISYEQVYKIFVFCVVFLSVRTRSGY